MGCGGGPPAGDGRFGEGQDLETPLEKLNRGRGPPVGYGSSPGRRAGSQDCEGNTRWEQWSTGGRLTSSGSALFGVAGWGRQGDGAVSPDADLSGRAYTTARLAAAGNSGA